MEKALTSNDLCQLLRARYHPSNAVLLFEVPDATGTLKTRTADAVVLDLWPSRGLTLKSKSVAAIG
jgi:hypothetical protein